MTAIKVLVIGIVVTLLSFGAIRGTISLRDMLQQADLVVVATVSQVESNSGPIVVNLAVKRTVKGTSADGQTLQYSWAGGAPGINGQPFQIQPDRLVGKSGIFFLKQNGSGWIVLTLANGAITEDDLYLPAAAVLSSGNQYAAGLTVDDKLRAEMQAASQDPSSVERLLGIFDRGELDSLGVGILNPLLQATAFPIANHPAEVYLGLAGQIRNGSSTAVISLAKSPLATATSSSQMLVASALCDYRNLDSLGISALAALTDSQYPVNIRTCATHALREIHTSTTLPVLKTLLDDASSWRIRYESVIGIAEYAMKFPVVKWSEKHRVMANFQPGAYVTNEMRANFPAMDIFERNEQQYINFWKTWLITSATSITLPQ